MANPINRSYNPTTTPAATSETTHSVQTSPAGAKTDVFTIKEAFNYITSLPARTELNTGRFAQEARVEFRVGR